MVFYRVIGSLEGKQTRTRRGCRSRAAEALRPGVPPHGSSGPELSDLCLSQKCVGADSGWWGVMGWETKCMCTDCVSAAAATVDRSKGEKQRRG